MIRFSLKGMWKDNYKLRDLVDKLVDISSSNSMGIIIDTIILKGLNDFDANIILNNYYLQILNTPFISIQTFISDYKKQHVEAT